MYNVHASGLHPANSKNKIANVTYLTTGALMHDTVYEEIDRIGTWAVWNNLRPNSSKSRELLILRGGQWRVL